jgi:hypothetical protein
MHTEEDLDIDNYDLEDLLGLFNLPADFNEQELKSAKSIVLKLHPDKSKLDSKYFLFYSKAYKILCNLWKFRGKSETTPNETNTVYVTNTGTDEVEGRTALLNKMFADNEELKNVGEFNRWFNREFEKAKIDYEDESRGYGDWLKQPDQQEESGKRMTMGQMKEEFARKKRDMCQDMILHEEVSSIQSNINTLGSMIGGSPSVFDNYGEDGHLSYQDLHKAHTETIIPVDESYLDTRKTFKTMDEMITYRGAQSFDIDELQQQRILEQERKEADEEATMRAYKLAKQSEEVKTKSNEFWRNMRLLGNK